MRILFSAISRGRIPPACSISTDPDTTVDLQMPQTPSAHDDGGLRPLRKGCVKDGFVGAAIESGSAAREFDRISGARFRTTLERERRAAVQNSQNIA